MIETVTPSNFREVLPLIRAYQEYRNAPDISEDKNRRFFSQFSDVSPFGCQFLYRNEERQVVAFATIYFTYASTLAEKVAILGDLYIAPEYRNSGIGTALIEHCRHYADVRTAARLQWQAEPEDETACHFYDALPVQKSPSLFYTYSI